MSYQKTKSTKRFNFGISRNSTSHKAGANSVTIATRQDDGYYAAGGVQMSMTVKEARALQSFLNRELGSTDTDTSVV
jgi:hypothetical protein|tara:strand:+ start:219 stop:449 length:231 start_codon:yes stop_codon:yes gene_type:complete